MSLIPGLEKLLSDEGEGLEFNRDTFSFRPRDRDEVDIPGDIEKVKDIDLSYTVIEPFVEAQIEWNDERDVIEYHVDEPEMDEREQKIQEQIKDTLSEEADISADSLNRRESELEELEDKINQVMKDNFNISSQEYSKIMYFLYRDLVGLGKIEPLMHDPYIQGLAAEGANNPVEAVHSEFGAVESDVVFRETDELQDLIASLAERCGASASYSDPIVQGSLPDGSRVNASLTEDVDSEGPLFAIKKLPESFSAVDLIQNGTADPKMMAYMWLVVQYHSSILVIGGAETGKTGFLNSILSFIPPYDTVASIEKSRELRFPHDSWLPSVARKTLGRNSETGPGIERLIEGAYQENPDYVVLGELEEETAPALFEGIISGHPAITTMHASGPNEAVKRLLTPPADLQPDGLESLDAMVMMTHAKGVDEDAIRVKCIHEVRGINGENQSADTEDVYSWKARDDTHTKETESWLLEQISTDYGVSRQKLIEELENRARVLELLEEEGMNGLEEISSVVTEYHTNREKVLEATDPEYSQTLDQIIGSEKDTGTELTGDTSLEHKRSTEASPVTRIEERLQARRDEPDKSANRDENPTEAAKA